MALIALSLMMLSPLWVESDAYRYATLVAVIASLVAYARTDRPRQKIGVLGWACIGWAIYVLLRYLYAWLGSPGRIGSSEGIYLFTAAFPALGYALYRWEHKLRVLPDLFMLISLVALGATIDLPSVLAGERTPFLIQNNTIHASVAAGLMAILSVGYAAHAAEVGHQRPIERALRFSLAFACLALCLLGIYGAKSKGVWLALGIALPVQIFLILVRMKLASALALAISAVLAGALLFWLAAAGMLQELGPHLASALAILDAARLDGAWSSIQDAIQSGLVPKSFNERLMLWSNAIEVWSQHFWFGAGPRWRLEWQDTTYANVPYTLIHNGFLEIAIRYGLTGLVVFGIFFISMAWLVIKAFRHRVLPAAGMQVWFAASLFFALTLLSNSNNRLAIGEAFVMIAAAIALRCRLHMTPHGAAPFRNS